jgi:acyl-CoA thioester hydrolase
MLASGAHKGNEYTYLTEVPVRWIDMDVMGHVNNSIFFTYFEQARCEHFDAVGLVIGGSVPEGPILAETSCKFRGPVLHGDVLTVGAECEKVDDTSWVQRYAVVSHASGRVIAEGSASLVWFDYKRGQRKSFSEEADRMLFGK